MAHKLPPFKSLKAFESVARLNSFAKAAAELFVSPGAVSQQVKLLEDQLNVLLLDRSQKSVKLTPAGEVYYPLIHEGFNDFYKAGQRLASYNSQNQLTVSALPSVASQWLSPKLFQWCDQNPEVELKIIAQHTEVDFNNSDVDFRISYGKNHPENLISEKLFTDEVFPVCSPDLLTGSTQDEKIKCLKGLTLLHVDWGWQDKMPPSWNDWIQAAGIPEIETLKGPRYNLSSMAIKESIEGRGLMLGQKMLVENDLAAGRLIKAFDLSLPLPEAYYIVYREDVRAKPHAVNFLNWLTALIKPMQAD